VAAVSLTSVEVATALTLEREAEDLNTLAGEQELTSYGLMQLREAPLMGGDSGEGRPRRPQMGDRPMPVEADVEQRPMPRAEGFAPRPRQGQEAFAQAPRPRDGAFAEGFMADDAFAPKRPKPRGPGFGDRPVTAQEVRAIVQQAFRGALKEAVKARLEERIASHKQKAKQRVNKMRDAHSKLKEAVQAAPWVDNGDGTQTKTIQFTKDARDGKGASGERKIERTVRIADGTLVSLITSFKQVTPNGGSHTMERSKVLQEDGSYLVTVLSVHQGPDGRTRTMQGTKTIGVDGSITGSGTLTIKQGEEVIKTIELNFSGTEVKQKVGAEDKDAKTEVTLPAEGAPEAVVTTPEGEQTEIPIETGEDGTVAPVEETAVADTEDSDSTPLVSDTSK
jgi:hypothetical protein